MNENAISVLNLLGIPEEQLPDYSVRLSSYKGGAEVTDAYDNHGNKFSNTLSQTSGLASRRSSLKI